MSTQAPIEQAQLTAYNPQWSLPKRLAFRFFFAYLGLYCLTTQILAGLHLPTFSKLPIPMPGTLWPLRQITFWTATHIFRIDHPLVYMTGTGDKTFDWVQAFCLFVLAALGTVVWSFLDINAGITFFWMGGSGSSFAWPWLPRCSFMASLKSFRTRCLSPF